MPPPPPAPLTAGSAGPSGSVPTAVDVLVVGAGPAGTAAACAASQAGLRVTVVDRATFPRDKCCGDGLTSGALRLLQDLGLDPTRIPSWQTIDGFDLVSPAGRTRRFELPDDGGQFAAVARRRELDAAMVDLTRDHGVEVAEGTELVGLDPGRSPAEPVVASLRCGRGLRQIRCTWLVAADGMWSATAKLAGPPSSDRTTDRYLGQWHAFRQYLTGVDGPAAQRLMIWFEPDLLPGYVWSFPLADGAVNFGLGMLRHDGRSVQPMKRIWAELRSRPAIAAALGPGAEPESDHRAWPIPAQLGGRRLHQGRVLFVGDAAAAADPMTGEGIGQAIETAQAAIGAIVAGGPDPDRVGARYAADLDRGMIRDHRLAARLGGVLGEPRRAEAVLAIVGSNSWTRTNFARWLFEDYPRAVLATPNRWHRRMLSGTGAYRPD